MLATFLRYLTGEFYTKATCENFQAENRSYYDELVFLGTEEEFLKKYAWNFILLAQYDRYEYD